MSIESDYKDLLSTLSGRQWQRIGISRRAGVAVPLFAVYSSESLGIGDLFDLVYLIDWCVSGGMSIVQLLPMNDAGFNFRPYDAQSMFALDPMYLTLRKLIDVDIKLFKDELDRLREKFPINRARVNYEVKSAKLDVLWKMFKTVCPEKNKDFESFISRSSYWLTDYALFKVIKEKNNEMAWEGWSEDLKHRDNETLSVFKETYRENILFHQWLQWQLFEQFKIVKKYAREKGVLLFGDLPFLVSRDSADVWSRQDFFKLDLASGAPPDMLFSKGQRWGMPPYNWDNIAKQNYDYLVEKLKYAQNFYDLYRIDHVVGIFRVWTIRLSEPLENAGFNGVFDPPEENLWEQHGRNLLTIMVKNTDMLACAEDLGTVPDCSFKVLDELGIPGIDVQRWMRNWKSNFDFKDSQEYRKNAITTISTHDMSNLRAWWKFEAGTVDKDLFERKCRERNIDFEALKHKIFDLEDSFFGRLRWKKDIDTVGKMLVILGLEEASANDFVDLYKESFDEKEKFLRFLAISKKIKTEDYPDLFIRRALEKAGQSRSIFSIQIIYDWLFLGSLFKKEDPVELRVNFPGTMSDQNWSQVLPVSLEKMIELDMNNEIRQINSIVARI